MAPADGRLGSVRQGATALLGTPHGFKSMNAHIHLLEALTGLRAVWPDPVLTARLNEVFEIVRDRIAAPPGALHLYFAPDWRPVPGHDSYGHDVETSYLLLEAHHALGRKDTDATLAVARSLVDNPLRHGWDNRHGGWFQTVSHDGAPERDRPKGSHWKSAYHNGRALLNAAETLRRLGASPPATPRSTPSPTPP